MSQLTRDPYDQHRLAKIHNSHTFHKPSKTQTSQPVTPPGLRCPSSNQSHFQIHLFTDQQTLKFDFVAHLKFSDSHSQANQPTHQSAPEHPIPKKQSAPTEVTTPRIHPPIKRIPTRTLRTPQTLLHVCKPRVRILCPTDSHLSPTFLRQEDPQVTPQLSLHSKKRLEVSISSSSLLTIQSTFSRCELSSLNRSVRKIIPLLLHVYNSSRSEHCYWSFWTTPNMTLDWCRKA